MTHTVFTSNPAGLVDSHQRQLGAQVRASRLALNWPQDLLAEKAGIAIGALKNLESGRGASLRTLTSVICAMGRQEWLGQLTQAPALSRQRARTANVLHPRPISGNIAP